MHVYAHLCQLLQVTVSQLQNPALLLGLAPLKLLLLGLHFAALFRHQLLCFLQVIC